MADVTYYFDAYDDGGFEWTTTPAYAVDNILTNYASTTVNNDQELLTSNTCPGTNLGTITKVEIRAYAYGDGDDELIIASFFPGGFGAAHITVPGAGSPGTWGAYQDITNDPNAPNWSDWAHVQSVTCKIELDDTGKGNTMHCAKVEIRVTYTLAGALSIPIAMHHYKQMAGD